MTNTSTARRYIVDVADAHGWLATTGRAIDEDYTLFTRGAVSVRVFYNRAGIVTGAKRNVSQVVEEAGARGKRETVLGWLRRPADLDAPLDLVQRILDAPVPDQHAADEEPAEGTYATLDEAEHGQPLAALERLADQAYTYAVAAGAGQAYTATLRDHASTVRARILELEELVSRLSAQLAGRTLQAMESAAVIDGLATAAQRLDAEVGEGMAVAERQARELARSHDAYRRLRERVTELEDQRGPARARLLELVEAMTAGGAPVTLPVRQATAELARLLGTSVRFGPIAELDLMESLLESLEASTPELTAVGTEPEPATAREILQAEGHYVRPQLPGESVEVTETTELGQTRIYGALVRPLGDGPEFLATSMGRKARAVPRELVAAYLAGVRVVGFPGPSRRWEVLENVAAAHGVELAPVP